MTKTNVYYMNAVIAIAESLDWNIDIDDDYVTFQKYSPEGQGFNMTISIEEKFIDFCQNIYTYYDEYDPSQEAYYWLDSTGHGTNGAPYNMRDVYDDMEACQDMIYKLWQVLYNEAENNEED